ncbi:MAG: DUF815 domain-containing protein, partial [Candidatus Lokiarchaeota archaeon]
KGIALFSWDQKIGSILECKYPENFNLSQELINKIYMTHAYNQDYENDELFETNYNDQAILSYCDKTRVSTFGYEILVAIIENQEKENLYRLKTEFSKFSRDLFGRSKEDQKKYFHDNIEQFFPENSARKILMLGRAGTGKSTIKKIIFEGKSPQTLLYKSLEPTRGITPSTYSWLDLKLGVFDSSGQELKFLLEIGNNNVNINSDQRIAFDDVDVILYIFDYYLWKNNKEIITQDINDIRQILEELAPTAHLILFFHKTDLIIEEKRESEIKGIYNEFQKNYPFKIYFTSIVPALIYSLYNSFYSILSSFSKETMTLQSDMDDLLREYSKTMCFITNPNNSIILQSMTSDFNTSIINHSHKLIAQLSQNFENMTKNGDIKHLILSGSNNLTIILRKVDKEQENMKNLVCISESLSPNNLICFIGKLHQKIINV